MNNDHLESLAKRIKEACLAAAREGFEDAELSGLCREGCVEAALSAIEMVDIDRVLNEWSPTIALQEPIDDD